MRAGIMFLFLTTYIWAMAFVPDWYEERIYQNSGDVIYGYGVAKTRGDAILDAKAEISGVLKTKISSSLISKQTLKDSEAHKKIRRTLHASSRAELVGAEVVRDEQSEDGKWYVVVKYLNLSVKEKAVRALKDKACQKNANDYLLKTPLIESINRELSCAHAFELMRLHGSWYLKSGAFKTPLSKEDFDALFKTVYSDNLELIASKTILTEDEVFNFIIKSKKEGFVSLVTVYEDGKVGLLLSNEPITPKVGILFPKADADVEMVAGLVEEGKATQDLYVLIFSKKKMDMTRFEAVSDQLISSEQEYRFSEVIEILKKGNYTTLLLKTLPKRF